MAEGIGAQDRDIVQGSVYPFDYPYIEAGEAYALARKEANDMRRNAFYAMPDFGTPRGTALDFHPAASFVWDRERERGIPSW